MKQLEELSKDFGKSRPVFRLTRSSRNDTINANVSTPVHKYRPQPEEGNILSELVCSHFSESFNPHDGEFRVDPYEIAKRAMEDIRGSIPTFLEKNLEMRNPRQSKLYRWYYRNLPNSYDFNDTLVMVYKYMRSFSDESMKASDLAHINNPVALLTAIMEKYEER